MLHIGLLVPVVVLSLTCLCRLVPSQGATLHPQLLLFSGTHNHADTGVTDDELMALATTTGQAVSVSDDDTIMLAYSDSPAPVATTSCGLQRHDTGEVAQNPILDALVPAPIAALPVAEFQRLYPHSLADYRSPALPPPVRPPNAV